MNNPSVISLDSQHARGPDDIRIFLRDCRIELSVGHHPRERIKPQPVIVNIEVEALLPHHYQDPAENSLDRVIDYERFYDFVRNDLSQIGHIALLETVAERIISFCFEDRRIHKVRVQLEKPHVFDGNARAGIAVCRTRPPSHS